MPLPNPPSKEPVQWGWVGEDAGPGSSGRRERSVYVPALQGTSSATRHTPRVCRDPLGTAGSTKIMPMQSSFDGVWEERPAPLQVLRQRLVVVSSEG